MAKDPESGKPVKLPWVKKGQDSVKGEDSEDEERAKQAVENLMRQFPEPVLNGRVVARPYDDDEQLSESSSSSLLSSELDDRGELTSMWSSG